MEGRWPNWNHALRNVFMSVVLNTPMAGEISDIQMEIPPFLDKLEQGRGQWFKDSTSLIHAPLIQSLMWLRKPSTFSSTECMHKVLQLLYYRRSCSLKASNPNKENRDEISGWQKRKEGRIINFEVVSNPHFLDVRAVNLIQRLIFSMTCRWGGITHKYTTYIK